MRTKQSLVRLPHTVLNEEIAMITGMEGTQAQSRWEVCASSSGAGGCDAVLVGSRTKGKELNNRGARRRRPTYTSASPRLNRWPSVNRQDRQGACSSSGGGQHGHGTAAAPPAARGPESESHGAQTRGFLRLDWELEDDVPKRESVGIIITAHRARSCSRNGKLTGMRSTRWSTSSSDGRIKRRAQRR